MQSCLFEYLSLRGFWTYANTWSTSMLFMTYLQQPLFPPLIKENLQISWWTFFSLIGIVFPILSRAADCCYRRGEVRQRMMALPRSCSICDCYLFTQLSNFQYWFFYETWSIKLREHLSNTSRNSEIMDKTLQRLQWILIQKAL